jgi:segregation and condensation protein B
MDQGGHSLSNNSAPAPVGEDKNGKGKVPDLVALVESLLFVADQPVPVSQLAQALEVEQAAVDEALDTLRQVCYRRGVRLQQARDRVQLVSAPEAAPYIERFLGLEVQSRLSTAALESLAIVAYQQPVTRAEVEAIRGVNSDSVLRTLTSKGLIEEIGRLDAVGRPIIYGTTFEFLQFFGLEKLKDLPPLQLEDGRPPEQIAGS